MGAHRGEIRALLNDRLTADRLEMRAVGTVDDQRLAVPVAQIGEGGDVLQNTVVVRAGDQHGGRRRMLPQCALDVRTGEPSGNAGRERLWEDKMRREIEQRHRVCDRLVAVPVDDERSTRRNCGGDGGLQCEGGAAGQKQAVRGAEHLGGMPLGGQNRLVSLIEIAGALDLRVVDGKRIGGQGIGGASLVTRHMKTGGLLSRPFPQRLI